MYVVDLERRSLNEFKLMIHRCRRCRCEQRDLGKQRQYANQ